MKTNHLPYRLASSGLRISETTGLPPEAVALAMCAVLGGLSGRWEGARDAAGTIVAPNLNLIVAAEPGPDLRRLATALTGTAAAHARALLEHRVLMNPATVEMLQKSIRRRATEKLLDPVRRDRQSEVFTDFEWEFKKIESVEKPVVYLRYPGVAEILSGLADSAERRILVDFFESNFVGWLLNESGKRKADRELATLIFKMMRGGQCAVSRGRGRQGHDIVAGRVSGLFGARPESLKQALRSQSTEIRRFLGQCVFLDLSRLMPTDTSVGELSNESGLINYFPTLIREVLWRRRLLLCHYPVQNEPANRPARFPEFEKILASEMGRLPAAGREVLAESALLPVKLFATFLPVENSRDPEVWERLRLGAGELAAWAVRHQATVAAEVWGEDSVVMNEAESLMVNRLLRHGPMTFRDLTRTYDQQKADIHRPVLQRLLERGFIRLTPDGLLALADGPGKDAAA